MFQGKIKPFRKMMTPVTVLPAVLWWLCFSPAYGETSGLHTLWLPVVVKAGAAPNPIHQGSLPITALPAKGLVPSTRHQANCW
jgi:hypothetical protein